MNQAAGTECSSPVGHSCIAPVRDSHAQRSLGSSQPGSWLVGWLVGWLVEGLEFRSEV